MKELSIEDKKIVLKDLSARLLWNVKVLTPNDQDVYTLLALHPNKNIAVIGFEMDGMYVTSKVKIEDCKPYLRPMSSMSDREKREYLNTQDIWQADYCAPDYIDTLETYDWLNAHHFDYRGLIEKGLAIAVTTDNNPYKNE